MIPPGYFDLVRRRESGGNDSATNPRSSASGRYQFTDNTFVNTLGPLMPGKSREEILALKNDPRAQDQAMTAFTTANANSLKNAGFEPTAQNLYLAHHYGAGGATKLLQANPNTPLNQIFGPEVFAANPYMNNIADAQGLIAKWSGGGGNSGGGQQTMQNGMYTYAPPAEERDTRFFKPENFGNSLINAGAAIASINSPAAGAAIAKLAQNNDSEYQTSVDQNTGQIIRVNKRTGAVQVMAAPAISAAREAADRRDMDQKIELYNKTVGAKQTDPPKFLLERWDENDQISAAARANLGELNRYTEALNSGMLDPTLLGKSKAELSALAGKNDPKANLAFEFKGFLEKLRNDSLRANKGMQTEGDAIRAMNEFISGTGQFNPYTTQTALSRFAISVADQGLYHTKKNEEYLGRNEKTKNYFDKDGFFTEEFTNRKKEFETMRQTFDERRKALTAPGAGASIPGETPEQRQQRLMQLLR